MKLTIPELCLVVLVGPSGCGKSSFARRHFAPHEAISSDFCRGLVSNDENSQEATGDAFDVLQYVAGKRLARGLLTVVDATNVQPESRKPIVALAREHDVLQQSQQLRRHLRGLEREGFRYVYVLNSPEEVEQAEIERQPLWNNRKWDRGPFDIVGDVHGCFDELVEL